MPTLHATNTWNVKASIIRYFRDQLALISPPSILGTYTTPIDEPEEPITPPAISLYNIPAGSRARWQGNRVSSTEKGVKSLAILEVSGWAARSNFAWAAQLDVMQGMVEYVYASANEGIPVFDYASNPTSPTKQPYLIRLGDLEVVQTSREENVDIERRRILIDYWWVQRVTA